MAREVEPDMVEAILRAIGQHPDGATLDQIGAALEVPRRTLQRRLAALVVAGRLRASGHTRQRLYHVVAADDSAGQLTASPAGQQVRALVRQPLIRRVPIGFVATFLEDYRPNVDFYLDAPTRSRLHERGRSPGADRPAGTYARQVLGRLLVDLDTQNLIELGRRAPGKDQREAQMILNHKAAIEMLVENVEEVRFDRYTLCNLHALLADNLLADPSAAGRLRRIEVGAIPQQLEQLFDLLLAKAAAIEDPFEQAFFALVHLPYLQPFEDVNKRVSRLAANIPFIKHNLAPLSFVDVPERDYIEGLLGVYELQRVDLARDVFTWAYERSCQRYTVVREALPQPDPLRLRNRDRLTEVVNTIVRDDAPIDDARIRELATPMVPPEDLEQFIAMAISELSGMHEGNLARYRLRLSEFRRWRGARSPRGPS